MEDSKSVSEYNSVTGWKKEISKLTGNGIAFLYCQKDYWAKNLMHQCDLSNKNETLHKNILAMMSFSEWHIYLCKIFHFLKNGIIQGVYDVNTTLRQCNIPNELALLHNEYYNWVDIEFSDDIIIVKKDDEKELVALNYYTNLNDFTLLDVAIALHAGCFMLPTEYIAEAIDLGVTKYHQFEYTIPFIDNPVISFRFTTREFSHTTTLQYYYDCVKPLLSQQEEKRETSMSNILTGERVRPRDGTYYIDDFR